MAYSKYCSVALALFILLISNAAVHAQRTIGVDWQVPEDSQKAVQQLEQFDNLGISIVKLTPPLPSNVWDTVNELDFSIYGNVGITYPRTKTFANPDSSFINVIQEQSSLLLSNPSVKAVGLFSYGPIQQKKFRTAIKPFISELKKTGIHTIYAAISTRQTLPKDSLGVDFIIRDISVSPRNINNFSVDDGTKIGAYQYYPSASLKKYITPFKQFIDATAENPQKPIFVSSKWLLSAIETHPSFTTTIQSLTTEADPIFLMPEESLPASQQSPVPIILLLIIWASVALHYNSSPLYRKSVFRYFNAHKFFIDDIFQRHIRSVLPAIILIFQNAVLMAAILFAFVKSTVSPLGLDALFSHFSFLGLFGKGAGSLAIWMALFSLFIAFSSIIWLYISHKRINSLTQIAIIYAWPLQLNLLSATILIVLFASGATIWLITVTGVLALLIQLLSFVITSFDTARFVPSYTLLYILLTSGLYLIIIGGLLIWGLTTLGLQDIIALILTL